MKKRWKTLAAGVAGLAVLVGIADYGFYYLKTGRYVEATDDAYLKADYTTIAPKVSGYIGQVLVDLDRRARRHARRLHGGAEHPDRQRLAANIQGAIGAGIDDGGWISTSYLIAEIIVIPLTGWLARCSRSAAICWSTRPVPGFSVACALAQNLPQMIVLRACRASPAAC
jgi:hypothetical protein